MFWVLFRALCCLCSNRQSFTSSGVYPRYYYEELDYGDSDDEDEYDEDRSRGTDRVRDRALKLSRLKRKAIDAAANVSAAEYLLARYNRSDPSLLMYHDKSREEMIRALDKLPPHASGAH